MELVELILPTYSEIHYIWLSVDKELTRDCAFNLGLNFNTVW